MNLAAKITWGLSALTVVGLAALAAPAVASTLQTVTPIVVTAAAAASAEPTDDKPVHVTPPRELTPIEARAHEVGCDEFAAVGGYASAAHPSPRPDKGAREFATGPVTFGADGGVETYTVQPGDAGMAIGERFCVDYITVYVASGIYPVPHPGDVLLINPGPPTYERKFPAPTTP